MALQTSRATKPRRDGQAPYTYNHRPHERVDSAPFVAWYDRVLAKRRTALTDAQEGAAFGLAPPGYQPLETLFESVGISSRRVSQARTEDRVGIGTVDAALLALDPSTQAWELAWEADMAVRDLVPFRDARGRDLLEEAIEEVERWHRLT